MVGAMAFSKEALLFLKRAGWDESYRYDTQRYEEMYTQAGCPPPEPSQGFCDALEDLARRSVILPWRFPLTSMCLE